MQTAEFSRFSAYVEETTRPVARAKRLAMFQVLDGREAKSMRDLSERVGGNKLDAAWISQAIRDGEIVITSEGTLCLPDVVAAIHESRALPRIRADLAKLVDELLALGCPDEQSKSEEGRGYWSSGIGRLVTGSRLLGCSFDLDDMDEEWKDHGKALKRFYKKEIL